MAVKVFYRNCFATQAEDTATPDSGMSTMSSTDSHDGSVDSPLSTALSDYGNFRQVSEQMQLRRQDSLDCRNLKVGNMSRRPLCVRVKAKESLWLRLHVAPSGPCVLKP